MREEMSEMDFSHGRDRFVIYCFNHIPLDRNACVCGMPELVCPVSMCGEADMAQRSDPAAGLDQE
jgi:hypothetical protein